MYRGRIQPVSKLLLGAGTLLTICATLAEAQYHGPPGFGSGGPGSGYGGSDDGGSGDSFFGPGAGGQGDGSGPPAGFGRGGPGFDIATATRFRTIHGILAALAFVVLFPLGSIFMRIIPGRFAIWIHALTQVVAYIVYVAAAALGFWLIQEVQLPFRGGGNLMSLSTVNYHPIIGIVLLVALFLQPFFGILHHSRFKKLQRRQVWSYLHLWNGRLMIPLGIINGGLGLRLAGASRDVKIAYIVVAVVLVGAWIGVAIFSECRRAKKNRLASKGRARRTRRGESAKATSRYR